MQDFTISFTVDKSPQEVFDAINNVRAWWSESIEGDTATVGAEFKYHFKDLHRATFKITELTPGKKVAWHVVENYFSFIKDNSEWQNTDVVFDIAQKDGKTEVTFTHIGLVPSYECYGACSEGWSNYIYGSLKDLINTGKGSPNVGDAITENESELQK